MLNFVFIFYGLHSFEPQFHLVSVAGTTLTSGGQTIRVATPGSTVLKAASGAQAFTPGQKQVITVHRAGNVAQGGTGGQPQIVTLVKTSQGMTVATVSQYYCFY